VDNNITKIKSPTPPKQTVRGKKERKKRQKLEGKGRIGKIEEGKIMNGKNRSERDDQIMRIEEPIKRLKKNDGGGADGG